MASTHFSFMHTPFYFWTPLLKFVCTGESARRHKVENVPIKKMDLNEMQREINNEIDNVLTQDFLQVKQDIRKAKKEASYYL